MDQDKAPSPILSAATTLSQNLTIEPPAPPDTSLSLKPVFDIPNTSHATLAMPLCITSTEDFYHSSTFAPHLFNLWHKQNSFSRPVHYFLLLKWLVWAILASFLFAFSLRFVESNATRFVTYVCLGCVGAVQTVATLTVMSIDTQDTSAKHSVMGRNKAYFKTTGIPVINPLTNYCNICQVVVSASTKHCKPCNKCTGDFDHHCEFLSTCVGKGNYIPFCVSIVSATALSFACVAFSAWAFTTFFTMLPGFTQRVFGAGKDWGFYLTCEIVLGIAALVQIFVSVALFILTAFHVRLWMLGMTTIEFIETRDPLDKSLIHKARKALRGWRMKPVLDPVDPNPKVDLDLKSILVNT